MQASELARAEFPEEFGSGEASRAAVLHLVPFGEEASHPIADVVIDGLIGQRTRAVAEVGFPTRQKPVQAFAYVRPRFFVAGHQKVADLRLEPVYALLRGTCAGIEATVSCAAMRAEGIAEKVKALRSGVLHRGFGLVDREPELGHRRLCPRQRLGRESATEDDEIIGIGDDLRPKRLAASGEPPMFEEPAHVDVGEQRTDDAALRRAARAALSPTHAPGSVFIPLLD